MTLGDFRRITADLPDDTMFVNDNGVDADVTIEVCCERYISDSSGEAVETNHKVNIFYT